MNTEIVEESVCVREKCASEKWRYRPSRARQRFQLQTSVKRRQQTSFHLKVTAEQCVASEVAYPTSNSCGLQLGPGEFPEGWGWVQTTWRTELTQFDSKPCVFPTEVVQFCYLEGKREGWREEFSRKSKLSEVYLYREEQAV